jgi:Zn-dependent protease
MSRSIGIGTTELMELLISFIVLATAFSIIRVRGNINALTPDIILISGLGVGTGFLLHELAHKFVAQRYGYWAEFKLWLPGLILTLIMSFMGFIIAMPGAVMIHKTSNTPQSSYAYNENDDAYWDNLEKKIGNEDLWISIAGPITNIILAAIFFSAFMYFRGSVPLYDLMMEAFSYAFFINLSLAAFNLLPIRPMDGEKIFRANSIFWVIIAIPTILAALYMMFGGMAIFYVN